MNINDININVNGASLLADFLTGVQEIDVATYEQNINGDGKLNLSWRSSEGGGLPAGTRMEIPLGGNVTLGYFLQSSYTPTPNGDGSYTWSPSFISEDSKLRGIPVYKEVRVYRNNVGNNGSQEQDYKVSSLEWIYAFPYTGQAGTLVTSLNGCVGVNNAIEIAEKYKGVLISVPFDQDNIVSAAEKIASALGTNSTIEGGKVRIGFHDALATKERYDRFVVLGGTRNMGKHVLEGDDTYSAVTFRLTLPEAYHHSVMPLAICDDSPEGHVTKFLIFDDIYPKMELTIGSVRRRVCYLYNEDGTPALNLDGSNKTYTKFYITLNLDGEPYAFDVHSVIKGRTLGLVFQNGILCGREFDLAYYDSETDEFNSDEDNPATYERTQPGEYRICLVADGDTLLPNDSLCPSQGDKVTLTGVVLDDVYETQAKLDLLEAATPYVEMYTSQEATEIDVSLNAEEHMSDFLTGEQEGFTPGQDYSGEGSEGGSYIVTSVTTDMITGNQSVHFGTFEPQGKMASMANQLDTASVGASGATVGQGNEDYIRHTAAMSLDQFETLYKIYGRLGMKTVNNRVNDTNVIVNTLRETMNDVVEQADKKFDIWFLEGMPQPYYDEENETIVGTANFPASEWATNEEKEQHLQDICYDKTRPADGTGGMVWRWEKVGNAYCWKLVSDNDTIAALTQLADLSKDNILTPSEKLALRREWDNMIEELADLVGQSEDNDISATEYVCAYYSLWSFLNTSGQATIDSNKYIENAYKKLTVSPVSVSDAITQLDAYLAGHDTDTQISGIVAKLRTGTTSSIEEATEGLKDYMMPSRIPTMIGSAGNGSIDSAEYNALLTAYKTAKTALMTALSEKSLAKLDDMASDNVLTDIEKLAVIREYERMVEETAELIARAAEAGLDTNSGSVQYQYRDAYSALYAYLDDLTTAVYTVFSDDLSEESSPAMLYNGADSQITGATFTGLWSAYYSAAAALRQAIQSKGVKVFVTTGSDTPTPPYKAGDLWVHTDQSGKSVIRICVSGRTSGSFDSSEWVENTIYTDPRTVLAALAEEVFNEVGSSASGSVTVTLGSNSGVSGTTGDYSAWLTVLRAMLGDTSFTIAWGDGTPSGTPNTYSLHCQRVRFRTYTGGIKISMYNENSAWEVIQHSTSALIDNLGDMINLVVFGDSQNAGSIDSYVEGSGITTAQNFIRMFSEAQVWNGGSSPVSVAEAMFGLSVDIKYVNTNNPNDEKTPAEYDALTPTQKANYKMVYDSTANLSADKIEFTGKTVNVNAAEFILQDPLGNPIFVVDSNNNVTLNANVLKINANEVNWLPEAPSQQGTHTYMDVIPGGSGSSYNPLTQSKFLVDDEGNVTMNNATVLGTIYANAGKIGGTNGWTISEKVLTCGNQGQSGYMFLTTGDQQNSATVNGHSANDWRFIVGNKFGVDAGGVMYANSAVLTGAFTTAGGKIQLAETDYSQSKGYKWYGMAYVSDFDALAIGMRDYNINGNGTQYGGHLAIRGGGSVGGFFDVLVGGSTTQSILRMGQATNNHGIEIDGFNKTVKIGTYGSSGSGTDAIKLEYDSSLSKGHISATGNLTIGGKATISGGMIVPGMIINPPSSHTVYLPTNPTVGEMYIIKAKESGDITIDGHGNLVTSSSTFGGHSDVNVGERAALVIWDGSRWILHVSY